MRHLFVSSLALWKMLGLETLVALNEDLKKILRVLHSVLVPFYRSGPGPVAGPWQN